ncbi:hypothetical protein WCE37_03400 [Luteimonas sp. MJ250]|uniref:hypothetical protein n=1 Tax=Luteimonas sp. MJ250 TaxID=3129236 RepID=UPI0031BB102C
MKAQPSFRVIEVPNLMGDEGVNALLAMTAEQALAYVRSAAFMAINCGNLARAQREALLLHVAHQKEASA